MNIKVKKKTDQGQSNYLNIISLDNNNIILINAKTRLLLRIHTIVIY